MEKVKTEKVTKVVSAEITLKLTPEELATITAAVGRTPDDELRRALQVEPDHLLDRAYYLYEDLLGTYREAVTDDLFIEGEDD